MKFFKVKYYFCNYCKCFHYSHYLNREGIVINAVFLKHKDFYFDKDIIKYNKTKKRYLKLLDY